MPDFPHTMTLKMLLPRCWILLVATVMAAPVAVADDSLLLSGFESPLGREWKHTTRAEIVPFAAETAPDKVKAGEGSARWQNLDLNKWISLAVSPTDWSSYGSLAVWIRSETANGQKINLVVSAPREAGGQGYYIHQLSVDWTGWKHVVVPLSAFKPNRSPAPWSRVEGLRLTAGGWGADPMSDSVLHLDELRLLLR